MLGFLNKILWSSKEERIDVYIFEKLDKYVLNYKSLENSKSFVKDVTSAY